MSDTDELNGNLAYDYNSESEAHLESGESDNADDLAVITTKEESDGGQIKMKRPTDDTNKPISKRQKKLKNSKFHERKREQIEYDIQQKKRIPQSSPEIITEYFAQKIRENNPDLSPLELNDLYFKKTDFLSTEKFDQVRNLSNLLDFTTQFSKAPRCIIFSMSNMRVADVFRGLNGSKNCLKLFSKNKLKDDLASVERSLDVEKKSQKKAKDNAIRYYIATPTRMEKILEVNDLFYQGKDKLDIILDASYLDPKNNTLLSGENTKELQRVLKAILNKKSSVKILLY